MTESDTLTEPDAMTETGTTSGGGAVEAEIQADENGNVEELARIDAKVGQKVDLTVTTGIHDDVHIHGYDLLIHTGPGLPPARFQFQADTPGRFEIELEAVHKQIGELTVSP